MTDARPINPILKQALELGPPLVFFVAYLWIGEDTITLAGRDWDGFIVLTGAFVPLLLVAIGVLWWLSGRVSRIQVLTAVLVVVFGGLTVWLDDGRFFQMKTSLVYGLFAALLGIGLLRGQSWLEFVMEEFLPMDRAGWMILTRRLALAFLAMAVANEVVWRTQTRAFWVSFETFALPGFLFVVFMLQARLFEAHQIGGDGDGAGGGETPGDSDADSDPNRRDDEGRSGGAR